MEIFNLHFICRGYNYWNPFIKAVHLIVCSTPRIFLSCLPKRLGLKNHKNESLRLFIKDIVVVN